MVLTGGEVPRGVGGALFVVQQREGVKLIGGAGREVAQRVRPVAGTLHGDVARTALGALRQRDHFEPEAGVVAVRGRRPRDRRLLVAPQRHRQVGRRLRSWNMMRVHVVVVA